FSASRSREADPGRPGGPACVVYNRPLGKSGDDVHPSISPGSAAPGAMLRSLSMPSRSAIVSLVSASLLLGACAGYGRPNQAAAQLAFGVDMARRGLWDEALFRFQEAEKLDPQNPRIQSNMGVAYEAAGKFDKALELYKKALNFGQNDKDI